MWPTQASARRITHVLAGERALDDGLIEDASQRCAHETFAVQAGEVSPARLILMNVRRGTTAATKIALTP